MVVDNLKKQMSLFQNPVGFGQVLRKTGQKPGFSIKSKEAVPKTEVLEQPQMAEIFYLANTPSYIFRNIANVFSTEPCQPSVG